MTLLLRFFTSISLFYQGEYYSSVIIIYDILFYKIVSMFIMKLFQLTLHLLIICLNILSWRIVQRVWYNGKIYSLKWFKIVEFSFHGTVLFWLPRGSLWKFSSLPIFYANPSFVWINIRLFEISPLLRWRFYDKQSRCVSLIYDLEDTIFWLYRKTFSQR